MGLNVRRLLVGSPLETSQAVHERLSKVKALAVFSSDALSSVAYATEEMLLVLVLAGTGALALSWPIALAIATLLVIVATSYYQGIHAYPSGGGAYIISKENLGVMFGLVAGAALLIDYILTVAVSVSAGVAAITSAVPSLYDHRVALGILFIVLITWGNLRGVRESGTIFAIPTYLFIVSFLMMIGTGLARAMTGQIIRAPVRETIEPTHALTLFLILRAFSSGCTALTGIEAISNGVMAFKPPEARNASRTLAAMATLLVTMFLGITWLSRAYGIVPVEGETVVSQLARAIFGDGSPFYFLVQATTAFILILAANTSFNGFPRLASLMARDRFLPRQLTNLGDRLVFSNGILILGGMAAALLALFGGSTHALIPLYAVGVFLSFTLAQVGLVRHSLREREPGWRRNIIINGTGAVATGVVLLVIAITKFIHGAWIVIVLMPMLVRMFQAIHHHYQMVRRQLSIRTPDIPLPQPVRHHRVIVPISGVHRGTLKALHYARSLSDDVTAVMVDVEPEQTQRVREQWEELNCSVPLVVLPSPYRSVQGPLIRYIDQVSASLGKGDTLTIVLPEFVPKRSWHYLLHNQTALLLKATLLYRRTEHNEVIVDVPYYLYEG
ncbi:MAG TPA: APC family permease [Caldilineae bacterium]|nr:APC family permease [Caldilineae bacterium]